MIEKNKKQKPGFALQMNGMLTSGAMRRLGNSIPTACLAAKDSIS